MKTKGPEYVSSTVPLKKGIGLLLGKNQEDFWRVVEVNRQDHFVLCMAPAVCPKDRIIKTRDL